MSDQPDRRPSVTPLPIDPEEILAGVSQAGVPRPSFLKDDDDDGTVHSTVPQDVRDRIADGR